VTAEVNQEDLPGGVFLEVVQDWVSALVWMGTAAHGWPVV